MEELRKGEKELNAVERGTHKILSSLKNYESGILCKGEMIGIISSSLEVMRESLMELVNMLLEKRESK